ncbi:hypothetical protein HDU93_000179 [Gonapodya sp. JEL0774]|nr:hypothetical protein HDU93_000179 [Gonapodya sp. JEL0774]
MDHELKKRRPSKSTDAPPSYDEAWIDTLGDGASLASQYLIPPYKTEGKPNTVLPGDGSSAGACFPRPASTEGRLILDVYGSKFLGERQALAHAVIANPPKEVAAKGVNRETWEEWMTKFQEIMKEDSLSIVTSVLAVVSVVGIAYWRHKLIHQQRALAKLQQEFNTQVMEPHGMYFTTATSVLVRHYGQTHVMYFAESLGDFEKVLDSDSKASQLANADASFATTSSNDYNRLILGLASVGSVAAFAYTVRKNFRKDAAGGAVDPFVSAQATAGGALKNPKLVVYTYAGGAFATATALVGLGAFALLTGLSSYFGADSWSSLHTSLRQHFQTTFPRLVVHSGPEPTLSRDAAWRELVEEMRQEAKKEEERVKIARMEVEEDGKLTEGERRRKEGWGGKLKRAGEEAMKGAGL